ncbi:hypothetical protein GPJ61_20505 [Brevibacillus formosus]|uniref:hypothetical protein n=1 Tax=Brevibacillus formosus TaxID=54913 RepID=UPI001CA5CC36|nr:hypothetical protein [Brevibacillus formosus]MBW5470211.1 hypothetical protein [Brevibacillus formosus]
MEKLTQTKIKMGLWLSIGVLGVLALALSYSPTTFGLAEINKNKDVIQTETTASSALQPKEDEEQQEKKKNDNPKPTKESSVSLSLNDFSKEQREPFVKLATDAFIANHIDLPDSNYELDIFGDISEETTTAEIWWHPKVKAGAERPFKGLQESYFVNLTDVDFEKGTGTIKKIEICIRRDFASFKPNTMFAPYIDQAKKVWKDKNIKIPQSGYDLAGCLLIKPITEKETIALVDLYWYPIYTRSNNVYQAVHDKLYYVQFSDVDLKKGTGTVENVETDEEETRIVQEKAPEPIIRRVKLTPSQVAPYIQMAKDAFQAKQVKLPESGYWISSTISYYDDQPKRPPEVDIRWYPDGVAEGTDHASIKDRVYIASFDDVDLDKGIGELMYLEVRRKDPS